MMTNPASLSDSFRVETGWDTRILTASQVPQIGPQLLDNLGPGFLVRGGADERSMSRNHPRSKHEAEEQQTLCSSEILCGTAKILSANTNMYDVSRLFHEGPPHRLALLFA